MQIAGPRCIVVTLIVMALAFPLLARGQETATEDAETKTVERLTGDELTLKRLFPKKSPWGPRASGMSFSHEGRWGAYLYRPYIERRHGSDLWLYDTESGETRRVTMVSVMSEFQASARKAGEDRTEKAKKKRKKSKPGAGEESSDGEVTEDHLVGTWKGRLRSDEDPDGLAVTIVIRRDDDGALGGTLSTFFIRDTLAEITFDEDSKMLRAALVRRGTGEVGRLEAKIEDGAMRGSVAMASMKTTLEIEAERTGDEGEEEGDGDEEIEGDGDGDVVDRVDEKDADDEKAPRYSGVGSYVWSPTADELIFASEGDLYRYVVDGGAIDRLTRTQESERGVRYLPDGTGYTYMRGNSIIRVRWEDHLLYQLDPKLPDGHSLGSFELSKDGEKLAIVSQKGQSRGSGGTTVNIISYRSRFAQVRQVPRHMSDNKFPELETNVYLYERNGAFAEEDKLTTVHTHKHTGPRDILRTPQWALDSSRFAFTVFDQESGHMEVYEVMVPVEEEDEEGDADEDEDEDADEEGDEEEDEDEDEDEGEEGDEDEDEDEETKAEARLVYRFFHHGGPNTPSMMVPLYLADSRRIAMITEQSGYRQLHVLDPLYEAMEQVTRGSFEIYPIEASPDHRLLFATASKDDPAQEHVYRIDLEDYSMTRLTTEEGVYSRAAVSPDGMRVLANHADFASPTMLVAVNVESGETRPLVEPQPEEVQRLTAAIPTYFTYENRHGHTIHGHMFLPPGYTPEDERPLLVYVYGGPLGTRNMTGRGSFSSASYLFAYYMAEKHGYVTCTIDPRGVSGYGGLFEKSNFEKIGKPQTEDLVDGVEWFVDNHGVDAKRVGIHGWSFGGFQTQMCLYTEPDVFACGIAGAGPTEWENYNSWYSTGTVGESREGKTDLEKYSLLPLAKNLKAKLLLVHGMEDSNVLYQDTVKVYRELLKANKETLVELFLDPTGGHGLGGDVKTIGRYRKYEEFLTRVLGSEKVEEEEEE